MTKLLSTLVLAAAVVAATAAPQADDARVIDGPDGLRVRLPLTRPTGKVRLKSRSADCDYGRPVRPRQDSLTPAAYVEWQIGYDLLANAENLGRTSLTNQTFSNYRGERKFAYELGEIVFCANRRGILGDADVFNCYTNVLAIRDGETFEATSQISRTSPKAVTRNGLSFDEMHVSYPLFVHRFGKSGVCAEIAIREKQKAVGTQAMLYVCLPVTALTLAKDPVGRTLEAKECGEWRVGRDEAAIALEMFRVFGALSSKHRHDVLAILEMLFPRVCGQSGERLSGKDGGAE